MITITDPKQVNSVLGNNAALVGYDRLVLSPITITPKGSQISATVVLSSTSKPDMTSITGSLNINLSTGVLELLVPQIGFANRAPLTGAQITNIQSTVINAAQNSIENGLVTLGVIAGTQSAGV